MNQITKARKGNRRPVSCLFCRSRKLRCSRNFPCTNCVSRGLNCTRDETSQSVITNDATEAPSRSSTTFEKDVLARLRRLEEVVIGGSGTGSPLSIPTGSPMQAGSPQENSPRSFVQKFDRYNRTERSPSSEVDWLEEEITHTGPSSCLTSFEVEFKACSIDLAASSNAINIRDNTPVKCVWLPLHKESREIVDKYLTDITHLHHVVHAPSVRALVNDIYARLSRKTPLQLGDVALLLAMITSTTFFWTERDMPRPLFKSAKEAHEQTSTWLQRTLDLLDFSRRVGSPTIEDVQATIIVGFVICNVVGISSQAHFWFSSATSIAWQLSLHRIDHPQYGDLNVPRPDSIEAEVGRRVWWNLVGTDWQFSQFAGAQRGIYMINPRHMATNKPLNANDEDLVDGMEGVGQPIDQPTSMSYCLQRYRLAELCRELTDSASFSDSGSGHMDYQRIREIDEKMIAFIKGLPQFLSLDFEADQLPDSDPRKSTPITVQRYIVNSLANAQRCRIHLPYLTKISKDQKYLYSRNACLEAARMVIRTERQLRTENLPFVLMRLRSAGILHCVCMAIIVLLMDLCLNKSMQKNDREVQIEIFSAFGVLEEAKDQLPVAERILESFHSVLKRYNIPFVAAEMRESAQNEGGDKYHHQPLATQQSAQTALPDEAADPTSDDPTLPCFNDLLQEFNTNIDMDGFDWGTIFSELESPFMSM